ncbi:5-carboxymethyl-2-hydroxymuconate Delta-isomerase [Pseudomonas sp. XK-1]|uniref:5-carboxymethyl-2-hydroxymuconate Delta-isomerase n=1 Tax=Pseudomonas sp. XK-1 TaxID=3136019 RepID=UPI00311A917C
MPHCLVEGSQSLTQLIAPAELLGVVEDAAAATGLFLPGEVKLRLSLCEYFSVGGSQEDFVHLIFYILAGRTDQQKRLLPRCGAAYRCRGSGCLACLADGAGLWQCAAGHHQSALGA